MGKRIAVTVQAVAVLVCSVALGASPRKPCPLDKAPRPFQSMFPLPLGVAVADINAQTGDDKTQDCLNVFVGFGETGSSQIFASCNEASFRPSSPGSLAEVTCDGRHFRLVKTKDGVEVREARGSTHKTLVHLAVPPRLALKTDSEVMKPLPREPREIEKEPRVMAWPALPAGVVQGSFTLNTGGDQLRLRQVGLGVAVTYADRRVSQWFASCNSAGHGNALAARDDLDAADCDGRTFHLRQTKGAVEVVEETASGPKTIVRIEIPEPQKGGPDTR